MEVKLQALSNVGLQNGFGIHHVSKEEVVEAKFSQFGVKLLFGNTWSFYFDYERIRDNFKVYGQ